MLKLGIIGGGAMGSAILKGAIGNGLVQPQDLYLVETDIEKSKNLQASFGISAAHTLAELLHECKVIILAVKPQVIKDVLEDLWAAGIDGSCLCISIAAGVTLATLEKALPGVRFARVMPNTPSRIGQGVAAYSPGVFTADSDLKIVEDIFGCVGKVIRVPESGLDAVTAISGSGPAYVYCFIESLIDAGVMLGLSRDVATLLVTQTVIGSTNSMIESGEHPAKLKNDVTSPGGTTAAALFELENGAFAGTVMKAARAAYQRSKELA